MFITTQLITSVNKFLKVAEFCMIQLWVWRNLSKNSKNQTECKKARKNQNGLLGNLRNMKEVQIKLSYIYFSLLSTALKYKDISKILIKVWEMFQNVNHISKYIYTTRRFDCSNLYVPPIRSIITQCWQLFRM